MLSLVDEISAAGVQPVVVFPPRRLFRGATNSLADLVRARRPEVPMFDYHDPQRLPRLYRDRDCWFDANHLNERGARLFSAELAADWSRELSHMRP